MAYSEELAERVKISIAHLSKVEEKRMFGGLAFLVDGKMCINISKDRLMLRIDPELHADLTSQPGVLPVLMRGREYKGYIYVNESLLKKKKDFDYWIELALDYNKYAKASKKK